VDTLSQIENEPRWAKRDDRRFPTNLQPNVHMQQVGPFAPGWDRPIVAMGIAAALTTLIVCIFGNQFMFGQRVPVFIIANFFLFNATHTGLTFLMLAIVPEFRLLFINSLRTRRSWIFVGIAMVPALVIIGAVRHFAIPVNGVTFKWAAEFAVVLGFCHGPAQCFGLSMLYPRQVDCRKRRIAFQIERLLAKVFLFGMVPLIHVTFHVSNFLALWSLPIILFQVSVGAIIVGIALWIQWGRSQLRSLFLIRLFCYPFMVKYWLVSAWIRALHGVEYIGIAHAAYTRTASKRRKFIWYISAFFILVPYTILYLPYPDHSPKIFATIYRDYLGPKIFATTLCLCYLLEIMHYYIDAFIFRMRDPVVGCSIGPLFRRPIEISHYSGPTSLPRTP
jgi:hypothetical protein